MLHQKFEYIRYRASSRLIFSFIFWFSSSSSFCVTLPENALKQIYFKRSLHLWLLYNSRLASVESPTFQQKHCEVGGRRAHPGRIPHNQLNNLPHLGFILKARAELSTAQEREVGLWGSEVRQEKDNGLEKKQKYSPLVSIYAHLFSTFLHF